jgi:hypothetical protein
MKDISKYLIPAYYTILNTLGLPVYDGMSPYSENGSYILIGEFFSNQDQNKNGYLFTANILIDIVIKNGKFGFKEADNYAEQIFGLINSDNQPSLAPDFQIITTQVLSTNRLTGLNNTEPVFRRLIRFEHSISQS